MTDEDAFMKQAFEKLQRERDEARRVAYGFWARAQADHDTTPAEDKLIQPWRPHD